MLDRLIRYRPNAKLKIFLILHLNVRAHTPMGSLTSQFIFLTTNAHLMPRSESTQESRNTLCTPCLN
jgi:hypothetical protein